MRLWPIKPAARRRALVDAAVAAYVEWRTQCGAVRDAYHWWATTSAVQKPFAFDAYQAALDSEEGAAKLYARLMRHVGRLGEDALAERLAEIQISSGGLRCGR
jgi:hypothetical protein